MPSVPSPENAPSRTEISTVAMNEVGSLDYDPSSSARQVIETSALSGCIGTAVLCQGEDGASIVMSHFPPSVDGNGGNFFKLRTALSVQAERGRDTLSSVVMFAPGTDREVLASVRPEINRYRYVLGIDETTPMQVVPYIPGVSGTLSFEVAPDPNGNPTLQAYFTDVVHRPHVAGW